MDEAAADVRGCGFRRCLTRVKAGSRHAARHRDFKWRDFMVQENFSIT
jgi:hypothetical protein